MAFRFMKRPRRRNRRFFSRIRRRIKARRIRARRIRARRIRLRRVGYRM